MPQAPYSHRRATARSDGGACAMEKATVALGGDSLVLAGVAERLGSDGRFRLVTTDTHDPGIVSRLEAMSAHVLIVDLNVVPADEALGLVHGCHDLTLIGLDPGGGGLVAFSPERTRHFALDDLVRLIEQSIGVPAP
jgi:hypothetical protein